MIEHINFTNIVIVFLVILLVISFTSEKLTRPASKNKFSNTVLAGLAGLVLISIYQIVLFWDKALNTVVLFSLVILITARLIWLNYNDT